MKINKWLALILLVGVSVQPAFPCTVFMVRGNGRVLAGNNEDGVRSDGRVWFLPGEKGKFGRVYFGFSDRYPQGGMNEKGLFFDIAATPFLSVDPVAGKKTLTFNILTRALEQCATVNQALELFSQYNISMERAHVLMADATGDSAVVEADQVIRNPSHYQLITNFLLGHPEKGRHPCTRHQIATALLKDGAAPDMALCTRVLSATAQEGDNQTQYSNICDLKSGKIRIFSFHDFARFHELDLAVELLKGEHEYTLDELIKPSFAALEFRKSRDESISAVLLRTIEKENVEAAVKAYPALKKEKSLLFKELIKTGMALIDKEKYDEAIAVIRIYVREFPDFFGSHQFLAYAQSKAGYRQAAIGNLRKALKINPNSKFGRLLLNELTREEE